MTTSVLGALIAFSFSPLLAAADLAAEPFEDARARANQMGETDEGKAYEKRFAEAFARPMQTALQDCTKETKPPYLVNVVFVIAADGTTQQIIPAPEQPVSDCVSKTLSGLRLPSPPKSDWLVLVNITINP